MHVCNTGVTLRWLMHSINTLGHLPYHVNRTRLPRPMVASVVPAVLQRECKAYASLDFFQDVE